MMCICKPRKQKEIAPGRNNAFPLDIDAICDKIIRVKTEEEAHMPLKFDIDPVRRPRGAGTEGGGAARGNINKI